MKEDTQAETVTVKAIRPIQYKDLSIDEGKTADVETHIAERLIADGHAEIATEKEGKKAK